MDIGRAKRIAVQQERPPASQFDRRLLAQYLHTRPSLEGAIHVEVPVSVHEADFYSAARYFSKELQDRLEVGKTDVRPADPELEEIAQYVKALEMCELASEKTEERLHPSGSGRRNVYIRQEYYPLHAHIMPHSGRKVN